MVFAPGPIFANIVLADEINRTPPKTQSALLEAMQEHRVTIQGRTYQLEEPFYVFATQNPIELEGTYPLPEAQLDRFMFHIVIDHPPLDEEFEVVRSTTACRTCSSIARSAAPIWSRSSAWCGGCRGGAGHALRARHRAREPAEVADAPDSIKKWAAFGASVRAAQYLVLGGKARALTSGRYHVSFEDIRAARASGAAPSCPDQFPRAVGRRHQRRAGRQAARSVPMPGRGCSRAHGRWAWGSGLGRAAESAWDRA
jgi:MoxR-like ATPase